MISTTENVHFMAMDIIPEQMLLFIYVLLSQGFRILPYKTVLPLSGF